MLSPASPAPRAALRRRAGSPGGLGARRRVKTPPVFSPAASRERGDLSFAAAPVESRAGAPAPRGEVENIPGSRSGQDRGRGLGPLAWPSLAGVG